MATTTTATADQTWALYAAGRPSWWRPLAPNPWPGSRRAYPCPFGCNGTGQLQLDHMAEKVKDCRAAITEVLTQACQEGTASLSRKVIVERCWEHWRYSRKSVDNSLSWMAGSKHPEVVRVPSLRGHYRLSPRMIQTLSP